MVYNYQLCFDQNIVLLNCMHASLTHLPYMDGTSSKLCAMKLVDCFFCIFFIPELHDAFEKYNN